MGINNQQIQDAIARWQQQQNPTAATPPPPPATPPAVEPPPPAAGGQFNLAGPGGIVDRLYGGNSSQSERLTNGLNYAQAPTYAPNPVSTPAPPPVQAQTYNFVDQANNPNAAPHPNPAGAAHGVTMGDANAWQGGNTAGDGLLGPGVIADETGYGQPQGQYAQPQAPAPAPGSLAWFEQGDNDFQF